MFTKKNYMDELQQFASNRSIHPFISGMLRSFDLFGVNKPRRYSFKLAIDSDEANKNAFRNDWLMLKKDFDIAVKKGIH